MIYQMHANQIFYRTRFYRMIESSGMAWNKIYKQKHLELLNA
jgi:hypothetical protein